MKTSVKGNDIIFPILLVSENKESIYYTFEDMCSFLSFLNKRISSFAKRVPFRVLPISDPQDIFRHLFETSKEYYNFIDSSGVCINLDHISYKLFKENNFDYCNFKISNVPKRKSGKKISYGRYFRHPKTTQEARQNSFCNIFEWKSYELKEPQPRGRRKPKSLPSVYDDTYISYQKSWKKHRNTQWK